jgi:hypothetical protein
MYSYYALAAFGPKVQKYLWWKRYITQIQIIQFVILLTYCSLTFPFVKGYEVKGLLYLGWSQPVIYFIMFLKFYLQSYSNKNDLKTQ